MGNNLNNKVKCTSTARHLGGMKVLTQDAVDYQTAVQVGQWPLLNITNQYELEHTFSAILTYQPKHSSWRPCCYRVSCKIGRYQHTPHAADNIESSCSAEEQLSLANRAGTLRHQEWPQGLKYRWASLWHNKACSYLWIQRTYWLPKTAQKSRPLQVLLPVVWNLTSKSKPKCLLSTHSVCEMVHTTFRDSSGASWLFCHPERNMSGIE